MSTITRAIPAFLKVSLAVMFQYRGEIILWAIWGVIYPAVAIAMWSAALAGSESGAEIGGYEARDFAAYFLLTMVVGHVTTAWDVYEMGWLVRSGRLSPKLLRPLLPVWESLSDNVAYKVLTLAILIPIWFGVAWLTNPRFETTWPVLIPGLVSVFLAAALSFVWGYVVATASFWVTRMDAISEMWFAMSLFFGGRIGPVAVLPWPLGWIASALPFQWIIGFPSEALIGRLSVADICRGLVWQAGWLLLGLVAFRWIWKRGLLRYSAVGA